MLTFLETEYGDAQLDILLGAQEMLELDGLAQKDTAMKVYTKHVATQGSGIGAQDRPKGTKELWDKYNKETDEAIESTNAVAFVTEEADKTLNMLAFDVFPRFLKSKFFEIVMDELRKKSNPGEVDSIPTTVHFKGT